VCAVFLNRLLATYYCHAASLQYQMAAAEGQDKDDSKKQGTRFDNLYLCDKSVLYKI